MVNLWSSVRAYDPLSLNVETLPLQPPENGPVNIGNPLSWSQLEQTVSMVHKQEQTDRGTHMHRGINHQDKVHV